MNFKRIAALALAGALALGLCGCEKEPEVTVSVQSVGLITGIGSVGLADRYAGMVTAGETLGVEKDEQMQVKEVLVAVGDNVEEGQTLFTYDTETISLDLEKGKLELEQMKASLETKQEQIKQLEKERDKAAQDDKLSYTLQIQELEIDMTETEMNIKAKKKDNKRLKNYLQNDSVAAPITGRVQALNENGGTDEEGNPLPFIELIQTDVYRVKGTINEQNAGALMEGMPVVIRSRMDETQTWVGSVQMVDWANPVRNNNYYYGPSDEMTQSSKYPFYVTLEDDQGLMLGQHVYIEPGELQEEGETMMLPAWCLNDADTDSPWVWAVDSGEKLEKRSLKLGDYDPDTDSYPVLEGLTEKDYIAPPSEEAVVGASVVYYSEDDFSQPMDPGFEGEFGFEEGGFEGDAGFVEGEGFEGDAGFVEGEGFQDDAGFVEGEGFEGDAGFAEGEGFEGDVGFGEGENPEGEIGFEAGGDAAEAESPVPEGESNVEEGSAG